MTNEAAATYVALLMFVTIGFVALFVKLSNIEDKLDKVSSKPSEWQVETTVNFAPVAQQDEQQRSKLHDAGSSPVRGSI